MLKTIKKYIKDQDQFFLGNVEEIMKFARNHLYSNVDKSLNDLKIKIIYLITYIQTRNNQKPNLKDI